MPGGCVLAGSCTLESERRSLRSTVEGGSPALRRRTEANTTTLDKVRAAVRPGWVGGWTPVPRGANCSLPLSLRLVWQLVLAPDTSFPINFKAGVTSVSWDLRSNFTDEWGNSYTGFMLLPTQKWELWSAANLWDDDASDNKWVSCLSYYMDIALASSRSFTGLDAAQEWTLVLQNGNTTDASEVTGEKGVVEPLGSLLATTDCDFFPRHPFNMLVCR